MKCNGFKLVGISKRTTNKDGQSARDLGELWARFFAENVMESVTGKVSPDIISVYTDYEGDYTGWYTAFIGVCVSSLDNIPEDLTGREFKPDHFMKFVARGEMPGAVVEAWSDIWRRDKELGRKYSYDYEVYGPLSQNGEHSEVEIYLSVRN